MANPAKQKGTFFESLLVPYYGNFWPDVRRNTLAGNKDIGDIGGLPLPIEAKNCKTFDLAGWSKEAEREAENANAPFVPVVFKRKGVTDPAKQWVLLQNWMLVDFMLAYEKDVA